MFLGNTSLTHQVGGWQKLCTIFYWRLPMQHFDIVKFITMNECKQNDHNLTTHNGCQSIYMWPWHGRGFPSSFVLME